MSARPKLTLSEDVSRALRASAPVVALESTVITHGLPRPKNLELARGLEAEVRAHGATPATIAVLAGEIHVGLSDLELVRLADSESPLKLSQRELAAALIQKRDGGTTVAATMLCANAAGIDVFATGGIGGVHKESPSDISADLYALSSIPMIVVCAGAKAILDLPATLEVLETLGVPVVGYQTDEFPAFYSRESGLSLSMRADSAEEIVELARAQWNLGLQRALLVANPIEETASIPRSDIDPILERASADAQESRIHGQGLTPFLLQRVNELTNGRSLRANLALLLNNARLAAQIAARINIREKAKAI